MLEDFPVPASPNSRQLLAGRPCTNASVLSISFSWQSHSRPGRPDAHGQYW